MADKYFERSYPEKVGVSSLNIKQFLQEIDNFDLQIRSFLMIRHGKVIAEVAKYPFVPSDKRLVYSCSKTFTSTAIGFAREEGIVSLDDYVLDYFPEYKNLNLDERVKKIQLKHLLTMSTGHGSDSVGKLCNGPREWAKTFFETEMVYEPGEKFVYDSGGTYIMSEIITRLTGKTLVEYLKPRLFEPLHINDISWDMHENINTGAWGVLIKPEDLAKLGVLYLQNGVFEGKQVLSKEWVKETTTPHVSTGVCDDYNWSKGYGYQIWQNNKSGFRADGSFGQLCMVFPQEDIVIVTTSEDSKPAYIFPLVEKYLLSNLTEKPFVDMISYGALKRYMMGWEVPRIFKATESYLEEIINSTTYKIGFLNKREHDLKLRFTNSNLILNVDDKQIIRSSAVSYNNGETNYVFMPPSVSPIIGAQQSGRLWNYSAHHEWITDGVLKLTIWYRETGHKQEWIICFIDDTIEIVISNSCKRIFGLFSMKSDRNIDFGDIKINGERIK